MILRINKPTDKESVKACIDKLPDQQYIITIEKKKVVRTIPQNRLYWMWLNCISKETGNEPNDLHEYFGEKWLPVREFIFNGEISLKPISTTKLTTVQFKEYLDKIQVFASTELGSVLPNPEDLILDSFVDYYSDKF